MGRNHTVRHRLPKPPARKVKASHYRDQRSGGTLRINVDDHEMSLTLRGSCRVKAVTIGIYMIAIEAPIIHVLKYGLWNQFCRDVPGFIRYSQKQSSIRDGRR
jgi:hypothetical protein